MWHRPLAVALALLAGVPRVSAQDVPLVAIQDPEAAEADADSQSIGETDSGRLEHAFAVETGDNLATERPNRYGTRELVGLLSRAADAVARAAPGSRLAVGDLSTENGGPLAPHVSHQSGRDADVAFYVLDAAGHPVPQGLFLEIDAAGAGRRREASYRFDDARNWALLVAFVDDPMAEVQHVLIVPHLRARLLDYGRSIQAPADQLRRVEVVTEPIHGSERHDDHFHVRIYCSVGDRPLCLDRPPLHPWYDGTPSPQAVEAARAADVLRAIAARRDRALQRRGEEALLRGQAVEAAREDERARQLALEAQRQSTDEQRRAVRLSADERRALLEMRRMEAERSAEEQRQAAAEQGRASELADDDRRWMAAERRRAARLRAEDRARQSAERRQAAGDARRAAQLLRRADLQRTADARRAAQLLRRAEQLRHRRFPSSH